MFGSDWLFFFFQAEDGIRDDLVTGVQTCALPISGSARGSPSTAPIAREHSSCNPPPARGPVRVTSQMARSEERRVGKECRAGGAPDHEKAKTKSSPAPGPTLLGLRTVCTGPAPCA